MLPVSPALIELCSFIEQKLQISFPVGRGLCYEHLKTSNEYPKECESEEDDNDDPNNPDYITSEIFIPPNLLDLSDDRLAQTLALSGSN